MYWIEDIEGNYINLEHAFSIVAQWDNVNEVNECILVNAYFPFLDREKGAFRRIIKRFDRNEYDKAVSFMGEITQEAIQDF